jgi:hypothetical protein
MQRYCRRIIIIFFLIDLNYTKIYRYEHSEYTYKKSQIKKKKINFQKVIYVFCNKHVRCYTLKYVRFYGRKDKMKKVYYSITLYLYESETLKTTMIYPRANIIVT